jgi:hypothetical protein
MQPEGGRKVYESVRTQSAMKEMAPKKRTPGCCSYLSCLKVSPGAGFFGAFPLILLYRYRCPVYV